MLQPNHDDTLQLGQGVVAYGGPGNDNLESFGNATLFGNDGDDTLIAHAGRNVIFPGAGQDRVFTGDGDDTVVLMDSCEATSGKIIDLGGGYDVVISPLTQVELEARGVVLRGVEEFRIESDACRSECRNPPRCVGGGSCVVQADNSLGCECPPSSTGPLCDVPKEVPYERQPVPELAGPDDSRRQVQARQFINWYTNTTVGELSTARAALDQVTSLEMRAAFATVGDEVLSSWRDAERITAVEILGYLACQRCLDVLMAHFPTTVRAERLNEDRAVQAMIAHELAVSRTSKSIDFLLTRVSGHEDQLVRRATISALALTIGEPIRSRIMAAARPADRGAYHLISNTDPAFDAKYSARYGHH